MNERELERIRRAYEARDRDTEHVRSPGWADPAYRFYVQRLEWLVLREIAAHGLAVGGAAVLEVGCGAGYFTNRFAEYGAARAAGIDLMEQRVAAGRARYPQLELVAGDAAALPWRDGEFDLVTQFTCLSSVFDPGLRARIADEMWRVLRPGGVLLSFDLVAPHPLLLALRRVRRRGSPGAGLGTETRPVSAAELAALFPAAADARTAAISDGAGGLARRRHWLAELASTVPLLRSHLLFSATKPA